MVKAALSKSLSEELVLAAHYNSKILAGLCHLSPRHLQRAFQKQFHCSPQKWLDEQRLRAAEEMLPTGIPVKVVSFELGFKQLSHFSRQFKMQNQVTPSEFATLRFLNGVDVAHR